MRATCETNGRQVARSEGDRQCRRRIPSDGRIRLRRGLSHSAPETSEETRRSGNNQTSTCIQLILKSAYISYRETVIFISKTIIN